MYKDRRAYMRDEDFCSEAKVSKDGKNWTETRISDLSACGLKFFSDEKFNIGETLFFVLKVNDLWSFYEPKISAKGVVKREERNKFGAAYGVAFRKMSPEVQIRIDEVIQHKSRIYSAKEEE